MQRVLDFIRDLEQLTVADLSTGDKATLTNLWEAHLGERPAGPDASIAAAARIQQRLQAAVGRVRGMLQPAAARINGALAQGEQPDVFPTAGLRVFFLSADPMRKVLVAAVQAGELPVDHPLRTALPVTDFYNQDGSAVVLLAKAVNDEAASCLRAPDFVRVSEAVELTRSWRIPQARAEQRHAEELEKQRLWTESERRPSAAVEIERLKARLMELEKLTAQQQPVAPAAPPGPGPAPATPQIQDCSHLLFKREPFTVPVACTSTQARARLFVKGDSHEKAFVQTGFTRGENCHRQTAACRCHHSP